MASHTAGRISKQQLRSKAFKKTISSSADAQTMPAAALLRRQLRGFAPSSPQREQREVSPSTLTKELLFGRAADFFDRADWQTFTRNENFSEMDRHFNSGGGGSRARFALAQASLAAGAS